MAAAAVKVSRAAAKAAGFDLRKVTPSQYRNLCAAAASEVTATGAGLAAKGPGADGATACLGIKGAAGSGLSTAIGAKGPGAAGAKACLGINGAGCTSNGAGLAAANLGAKGPGAAGAKACLGINGAGLAAANLGANGTHIGHHWQPALVLPGVKGTGAEGILGGSRVGAAAAGGHGRHLAGNAIFGLRAGMCTDAEPVFRRLDCCLCDTLKPEVDSLKDSFERHSLELWRINYELQHAVDSLQEEMSTLKPTNTRNTIAIMATSLGTFFVVGSFLGPSVKKAWMGEAIAEMDRRAAVRRNDDEGGAQEAGGAGKAPAAKATATQEAGGAAAAPPGKAPAAKATATRHK